MDNKGFFLLAQVLALSLLLLAAATLFSVFNIYAKNQVAEDTRLTAVYLIQKEVAMLEGQLLSAEGAYYTGIVKENDISKNNILFHIQMSLAVNGKLKIITAKINWLINNREADYTLTKTVYVNE